jgi:rhodanese-related sulfurtransferase
MNPTTISLDKLSCRIGSPDCPVLIDVRIDEDFAADPHLLPGALRVPHREIVGKSGQFRDQPVVVYCQKGLKLSLGATAILREAGVDAVTLEGGQFAWRDAGLPMLSFSKMPEPDVTGRTVWVSPGKPDLNDLAKVWLIRRFADANARIIYIDRDHTSAVADKFSATDLVSSTGADDGLESLCAAWELRCHTLKELVVVLEQPTRNGFVVSDLVEGARRLQPDAHALEGFALALLDAAYASVKNKGLQA